MKFLSTKPNWMTDSTWRALRTAWQTFWASFATTLVVVLVSYSNSGNFDWKVLWLQGVVVAVAAAISKLMNVSSDSKDDK